MKKKGMTREQRTHIAIAKVAAKVARAEQQGRTVLEGPVTVIEDRAPTLAEAQAIVGGLVELVNLPDGSQLYCDEEGLLKGLPLNLGASSLAMRMIVGPALVLRGKARWS